MSDDEKLHDRVTNLEIVFMHLEQTVVTLDEVVRSQQKAIDALESRVARLLRPASDEHHPDRTTDHESDAGV